MNPFISFCLYVSARVFVQYLKSRPDDGQTADSLRFLLSAMNALKRRNPLTESFLVQLDVDLESLSLRIPKLRNEFMRMGDGDSNPMNSAGDGPKAPCGNSEGVQGILAYRDQSYFTGPRAEDGNPLSGPSLDTTNSTGFNSQSWLSAEQSMSGLTPSSGGGGLFDKGASGAGAGDNQGTNGSPVEGQSGGPTPNSNSTGRDANSDSRNQHLAPGQMNNSGRNSFNASPISPQQNLMGANDLSSASAANFFGGPSDFSAQQQQPQQQNAFGMAPDSWGGMSAPQQGHVPQQMGDAALRALMNMGPMDAMDLSSWDQGNENLR